MSRISSRRFLQLICGAILVAGLQAETQAGPITWMMGYGWNPGCCNNYSVGYAPRYSRRYARRAARYSARYTPMYSAAYAPTYTSYAPAYTSYAPSYSNDCCGVSAPVSYAPTYQPSYAPSCNSCQVPMAPDYSTYAPAYAPSGGCASGNCCVNYSPVSVVSPGTPTEANPDKTYKEGNGYNGDEGFQKREKPTTDSEGTDDNGEFMSPKTPEGNPETVPNRNAEGPEPPAPGLETRVSPKPLKLDHRVTWKNERPRISRTSLRSRFTTPKVARREVDVNKPWVAVPGTGTAVAAGDKTDRQ